MTKTLDNLTVWTKERLRDEARLFDTESEFREHRPEAVRACQLAYPGFLRELYPAGEWNVWSLEDEMGKHYSMVDFARENPKAYQTAFGKYYTTLKANFPVVTWTKGVLLRETEKYKSRTELKVNHSHLYKTMYYNHRADLDRVLPAQKRGFGKWNKKRKRKWTEEAIIEVAKKCENRSQFQSQYGGAYQAAIKLGIFEDVAPPKGKPGAKSTVKEVVREVVKEVVVKEPVNTTDLSETLSILERVCQNDDVAMTLIIRAMQQVKELHD